MKIFRMWVLCGLCAALLVAVAGGLSRQIPKKAARAAASPDPWIKVEMHLNQLEKASADVAEKYLQRISAFFADRKKKGAKEFADEAFGWTSKYFAIKSKIQGDNGDGFKQWLHARFEEHVLKNSDLQAVLNSATDGYVTELQGLENAALIKIRADLGQDQLFNGKPVGAMSDETFRDEYLALTEKLLPRVMDDLGIGLVGQAANLVASEVVARPGGAGLSRLLGVTGSGLLSSIARSSIYIGVGMAAFWVFDQVIDLISGLWGYVPSADLARKVEQGLDRMESQLIDGSDAGALERMQALLAQADAETSPDVQQQLRDEARQLEASGVLGLRYEFQKLHNLTSKLRRQALRKLIQNQPSN